MQWMIDGYSHRTAHPRHITQFPNVDDAGATIVDPSTHPHNRMVWVELFNADSNPLTVSFRQFGTATEWLRVRLLTNTNIIIPGWDLRGLGLEVFPVDPITDNGFFVTTAFPDGA